VNVKKAGKKEDVEDDEGKGEYEEEEGRGDFFWFVDVSGVTGSPCLLAILPAEVVKLRKKDVCFQES
jgi:hypothetical protein